MDKSRKHWFAASAGALALWNSPALAQTETQTQTVPESEMAQDILDASAVRRNATYLDLTGSLGYSTNPLLRTVNSDGSLYGRASARGVHMWNGELSSTSLSAFVEGTTYFNDYGVKSIFSVSGDHQRQVSERVGLFGSAGASGDLAGQLSNRFLYVPPLPEVRSRASRRRSPSTIRIYSPSQAGSTASTLRGARLSGPARAAICHCRAALSASSTPMNSSMITPRSSATARTITHCPTVRP